MTFSTNVQRVMQAEHISHQEMEEMLAKSAITSLYGYSKRYHHWLFKVDGDCVLAMAGDSVVVMGDGTTKMQEECCKCSGRRCQTCNWHGFVYRKIN